MQGINVTRKDERWDVKVFMQCAQTMNQFETVDACRESQIRNDQIRSILVQKLRLYRVSRVIVGFDLISPELKQAIHELKAIEIVFNENDFCGAGRKFWRIHT